MSLHIEILPYHLNFKRSATTSRGVYQQHHPYYVLLSNTENPAQWGVGEAAPLPDLSCDALPASGYVEALQQAAQRLQQQGTAAFASLSHFPSIRFALETAWRHYQQQSFNLWDTPFTQGKCGITINGLVWMADYVGMQRQIEAKIAAGFRCIKLKIGALNFKDELHLLQKIRQRYSVSEIELRVDANGAFHANDALEKLHQLAELELHSIEQPIQARQWHTMAQLIQDAPLPIALDEELIYCHTVEEKQALLALMQPHYLVLKPTLHGGIMGCEEWIELAEQHRIGWWVTSALESNIGLNAIAQWCSTRNSLLPQGLGTGLLYHNNVPSGLQIEGEQLWYHADKMPSRLQLLQLLRGDSA